MAGQNINQYVKQNWSLKISLDSNDMSLTSDEQDFNQEVIFSPYLIAQTYGNRLPVSFDINNPDSVQPINLYYKDYNFENIFVSENYYNGENLDLSCFTAQTSCDIGLTGIDNGLVTKMKGDNIVFTNGLFDDSLKFERLHFDRRLKLFQVTGYTQSPNIKFSGFNSNVLYEVVSKTDPVWGRYQQLYGGFYQGFYKLFGYDYEILPERMNKGWSVEMLLKPRFPENNEYSPENGETTLNELYPENKNMFFYFGTRAENKFYHHADGIPNCFVNGYIRVTTPLAGCLQTCSCCVPEITNSRCIFVYPPRSIDNVHDNHVNYGCSQCGGSPEKKISCGCDCYDLPCDICGWECQTHVCGGTVPEVYTIYVNYDIIGQPLTLSQNTNIVGDIVADIQLTTVGLDLCEVGPLTPICTPTCATCDTCDTCDTSTGYTSIENTCESNPLFDSLDNALGFKLCGEPNNPQIGIRVLRFTGDCITTGSCETSGVTYMTGYTVDEYCTPPIYPYCEQVNPAYLGEEHWFQLDMVWERYTWLDTCDLWYRGGLGDITETKYLESLANNTVSLITVPYTHNCNITPLQINIVNLNEKWLLDKKYREGRLKIYVNGKIFYTIENFSEIIPRGLNTDKEKQVGVPYNISWGGGTQGLRENLTFTSCLLPNGPYQQDPECLPTNDFAGTSLQGSKTNILIEQNFAGTFDGAISQFRMYMTPLSAPEVKHNFKLLKDTFNMFNPDCPDCSTIICETNDLEYEIQESPVNICFSYELSNLPTPTATQTFTVTPTTTPTPTPTQRPPYNPSTVTVCGRIITNENSTLTILGDGTPIPYAANITEWNNHLNNNTPCYTYWQFNPSESYRGCLYNQTAINNLPPAGWRGLTTQDVQYFYDCNPYQPVENLYAAFPGNWNLTEWINTSNAGETGLNFQGYGSPLYNDFTNDILWNYDGRNESHGYSPSTYPYYGSFIGILAGGYVNWGDYLGYTNRDPLYSRFIKIPTTLPQQLGRIHIPDERDIKYLIKDHFQSIKDRIRVTPTRTPTHTPTKTKPVTPTVTPTHTTTPTHSGSNVFTIKYWNDNSWWGNQGNTPQCVGYAWAHWIADGPVIHSGVQPPVNPTLIYQQAQLVDEWVGTNYDGTSVRGGVKYLQNSGKVSNYYWAFDVQTMVNTILNIGPVVVGTNWYNNMFYPNPNGVISIGGSLAGGHAYVINGVDTVTRQFRIKNSWGQSWGKQGHAFISFTDMTRLINENGEICLAVENNF
jgi:hypothetical protein